MRLNYNKQEVAHAIETKVKDTPRSTKENNIWYVLDGMKILRVTYPHGSGQMAKGTASSIKNQLKLNRMQFDDFVHCPLTSDDYEKLIRGLGLVPPVNTE